MAGVVSQFPSNLYSTASLSLNSATTISCVCLAAVYSSVYSPPGSLTFISELLSSS